MMKLLEMKQDIKMQMQLPIIWQLHFFLNEVQLESVEILKIEVFDQYLELD